MFDADIATLRRQIEEDSIDREVGMRRITVLQAVQKHLYCPECNSLLDHRGAVILERDTHAIGVSCGQCYHAKMRRIAESCAGRDRKYIESMQAGLTAVSWNDRCDRAADVMFFIW